MLDGNLAVDRLVEGDEGLGAHHAVDGLDFIVEQLHQVLVVAGIYLDEHGVGACGKVTFHNLGNFLQLGHHIAVHGPPLQVHADVGACAEA